MSALRKVSMVQLVLLVLTCAIGTTVNAALDPPHDTSNTIGCTTCHDLGSTEWKHLPSLALAPSDADDTVPNASCWTCHDENPIVTPGHGMLQPVHSYLTTDGDYGTWQVECWMCHNQHLREQGLTEPLIRKTIKLDWIINKQNAAAVAGVEATINYPVDGLSTPSGTGLCQVCHTETQYYTRDGNNQTTGPHTASTGQDCLGCHGHEGGFKGAPPHDFIVTGQGAGPADTTPCTNCHTAYTAAESAHQKALCQTCHTATTPYINNTPFTVTGDLDQDTGNSYDNLDVVYNFTGGPGSDRLIDGSGNLVSDAGFDAIECTICHNTKAQALNDGDHGGHAAGDFGWVGATETSCGAAACHDFATNTNVVSDIHVAAGGCIVCHDTASGGDGTSKVGDSSFGVDGSAEIIANGGPADPVTHNETCVDCHNITETGVNAGSVGGMHHWNRSTDPAQVVETDCASCHAVAGHRGDHLNDVANATVGTDGASCNSTGCHVNTAGVTGGGISVGTGDNTIHDECLSCHVIAPKNASDGQLDGTVDPPGTPGAPIPVTGSCVDCHGTYFPSHTSPDARHTALTTVQPCTSCHTGGIVTGATASEANQGTHESNCSNCHELATGDRVDGSFNAASYGNTALNVGDATVNGGAGGTCAQCHTGYFGSSSGGHLHTHQLGADADCATCHDDGTRTDTYARDAKTTPYVGLGEVHSVLECGTCHDLTTPNGALTGIAATAFASVGAAADCVDCHIDAASKTWLTIHEPSLGVGVGTIDHAWTETQVAGNADCTQCHGDAVAGSDAREAVTTPFIGNTPLEVHYNSGNTCATCHTLANDGGLRTMTGANKANTVVSGDCVACHIGGGRTWTSLHDTTTGAVAGVSHSGRVNGTASCVTCHTDTAGGAAGVMPYNSAATRTGDLVHDGCSDCHSATGKPMLAPYGYAIAIGTGGECIDCHGAGYFDSHVHGTDSGYISHNVSYNASVDVSQVSMGAPYPPCGDCHNGNNADGNGTPLDSWTDVYSEHNDGSNCARCHSYTPDGTPPDFSSRIGARALSTCVDCHTPKLATGDADLSSDHGGHPADFGADASCTACHDLGGNWVVELHNNNDCTYCHNGAANASTEKLGDTLAAPKSPAGDARFADGVAAGTHPTAGGNWSLITCTTCHGTTDSLGAAMYFHGITVATVSSRHQLSSDSSGGYDCEACHTANIANEQLSEHMASDTVAQCVSVCHGNTTPSTASAIVAKTVIDTVTFNDPEPNKNNSRCEECHAQKGDFKLHGLSDDDSVADGINNAAGPNSSTVVNHNNLSSAVGETVTYTGAYAGAFAGLKVTTYSCDDCHSGNRVNATSLEAMQAHTISGGGSGNCLTCHNGIAGFESVITAGLAVAAGGSNQTINCENCHNATINGGGTTNSPSGKRMYQYDGIRHHTTAHAQTGDCTWCHADPRPATPDPANGFASTAVAASSNSGVTGYDTGWQTDFSTATAPAPKQIGCRLCHTNYETYTANMTAAAGNHGYGIGRTTNGLSVYSNSFEWMGNNTYPSGNNNANVAGPTPIPQTEIHRIDANNGTSMINVYNYGACLGCHSIQYFHAAPVPDVDYQSAGTGGNNNVPFDQLRYAPGRGVFNIMASQGTRGVSRDCTTESFEQHMLASDYCNRQYNGQRGDLLLNGVYGKNPSQAQWSFGNQHPAFNRTAVPAFAAATNYEGLLTNGTFNGYGGGIVTFNDITAPAVDDIVIEKAEWDGSTLTVWASSTNGDPSNLTFTTSNGSCTGEPIAMTWVGGNTRHEDTSCTDLTYASGVTLTVTSATGTTKTAAISYVYAGPVAATANDDTFGAAPSAATVLDVLANDLGTDLQIVVGTVSAVTKTGGAGTCGTLTPTTANITYNGGSGDATCEFTYEAQAYDGATPFGSASQATVTVNQATDSTPPTVGTVNVSPTVTTYTSSAPTITATITDADTAVISCDYYTDGSTWTAGVVTGTGPDYTCTGSPTSLTGTLAINVRGTSGGGTAAGTEVARTVDETGPTDGTLSVSSSDQQNSVSWTAASDAELGMRGTNNYDLRFLTGATPPTCSTGTSIYTGNLLTYDHTGLTNGTQYSYRVCAYDANDNASTGATGSGTPSAVAPTSPITGGSGTLNFTMIPGTTGSYTAPGGTDRIVIALVASDATTTAVDFNGTPGNLIVQSQVSATQTNVSAWYLLYSGTGAGGEVLDVTATTGANPLVGVVAFEGVNQTTPFNLPHGTAADAAGSVDALTPWAQVSVLTDGRVFYMYNANDCNTSTNQFTPPTTNGPWTEVFDGNSGSNHMTAGYQTNVSGSAATVTLDIADACGTTNRSAMAGFALNPN